MLLRCIFPPAPSQQTGKAESAKTPSSRPVVLWPQYHLTGSQPTGAVEDPAWLVIGYNELWLKDLAEGTAATSKRQLVRDIRHLWLPRFQEALKKERRLLCEPDEPDEDGDAQEKDPREVVTEKMRFTFPKHVDFQIEIMDHAITVLNTLRLVVLRLDDAGTAFLQNSFAPSVQSLAHSQQAHGIPTGPQPTRAPFPFLAGVYAERAGQGDMGPASTHVEVGRPSEVTVRAGPPRQPIRFQSCARLGGGSVRGSQS